MTDSTMIDHQRQWLHNFVDSVFDSDIGEQVSMGGLDAFITLLQVSARIQEDELIEQMCAGPIASKKEKKK